MEFKDLIYGSIKLPDWLVPFTKIPELARLRGVRLSNVDSVEFKDFTGPNRWEHSIGVAYLALQCADMRGLERSDKVHLCIAALLHDVATPPFAHTIEHVLDDFNHELIAAKLLTTTKSKFHSIGFPVYASQLPQFMKVVDDVSNDLSINIKPGRIARLIVGQGELGYLICGTIDLDNADNVIRTSVHMGMDPDTCVAKGIAKWLAESSSIPVDVGDIDNKHVKKWFRYRQRIYKQFYNSSDHEVGRQAFLQHIIRKAVRNGIPKFKLIYNTDERLLFDIEGMDNEVGNGRQMKELVDRYRLLEDIEKISEIDIYNENKFRELSRPKAIDWIEQRISTDYFEPIVIANKRRYTPDESEGGLFGPSVGNIKIFSMESNLSRDQLPQVFKSSIPDNATPSSIVKHFNSELKNHVDKWIKDKPWLEMNNERKENIIDNFDAVGSWGFRMSRNDSIHPYPSTFVHAIPSSILNALGARSETVFDPFGGTGQTAVEAIRVGGNAISADNNSIATLVANTRLSFLQKKQREYLYSITKSQINSSCPVSPPTYDYFDDWHHADTVSELCSIKGFIEQHQNEKVRRFLLTCFSAILPKTTARRGKQHGYFADNTPLGGSMDSPPYQPAVELFIERIEENRRILENYYTSIRDDGRDPERELSRASVVTADITESDPSDYGISENSIDIIITSPPYLCMSDYSLGKRLSYYWILNNKISSEFEKEIGARRKRNKPEEAFDEYMKGLESFCNLSSKVMNKNAILAIVFASPHAKAFQSKDIMKKFDGILKNSGFKQIWSKYRPINWHRNHGYKRLEKERVSVHRLS